MRARSHGPTTPGCTLDKFARRTPRFPLPGIERPRCPRGSRLSNRAQWSRARPAVTRKALPTFTTMQGPLARPTCQAFRRRRSRLVNRHLCLRGSHVRSASLSVSRARSPPFPQARACSGGRLPQRQFRSFARAGMRAAPCSPMLRTCALQRKGMRSRRAICVHTHRAAIRVENPGRKNRPPDGSREAPGDREKQVEPAASNPAAATLPMSLGMPYQAPVWSLLTIS